MTPRPLASRADEILGRLATPRAPMRGLLPSCVCWCRRLGVAPLLLALSFPSLDAGVWSRGTSPSRVSVPSSSCVRAAVKASSMDVRDLHAKKLRACWLIPRRMINISRTSPFFTTWRCFSSFVMASISATYAPNPPVPGRCRVVTSFSTRSYLIKGDPNRWRNPSRNDSYVVMFPAASTSSNQLIPASDWIPRAKAPRASSPTARGVA